MFHVELSGEKICNGLNNIIIIQHWINGFIWNDNDINNLSSASPRDKKRKCSHTVHPAEERVRIRLPWQPAVHEEVWCEDKENILLIINNKVDRKREENGQVRETKSSPFRWNIYRNKFNHPSKTKHAKHWKKIFATNKKNRKVFLLLISSISSAFLIRSR